MNIHSLRNSRGPGACQDSPQKRGSVGVRVLGRGGGVSGNRIFRLNRCSCFGSSRWGAGISERRSTIRVLLRNKPSGKSGNRHHELTKQSVRIKSTQRIFSSRSPEKSEGDRNPEHRVERPASGLTEKKGDRRAPRRAEGLCRRGSSCCPGK